MITVPSAWLRARALADDPGMPPGKLGRILDVTPQQYQRDPCRIPSLNSSVARTLVAETPAHAYVQHPRLGGSGEDSGGTPAVQDGALIHKLLLGKGKEIAIIEAPDFRTAEARSQRDAALAEGFLPVLQHKLIANAAVAARLRDKCAAVGYPFDGESEVCIEWLDDGILCRSMLDHARLAGGIIYDVKKVARAHPAQIARTFIEYGYDIQREAYCRAVTRLHPELTGRVQFVFLFVEIEPPYSVIPAKPDGYFREIGALRWERALHIWRECRASGNWPSYSVDGAPITIEAPPWVVSQEIGSLT
jgi:hypothetical protein